MEEMIKIIGQTIIVRDLQKQYFLLRKGNGMYPSKESRIMLKASKEEEIILDNMLNNYIQAYNGLMEIETVQEKPIKGGYIGDFFNK